MNEVTTEPKERTREEIQQLKEQWLADPCWDLPTTDGFEAHRQELTLFEVEWRRKWFQRNREKVWAFAQANGFTYAAADYIMRLEARVEQLEEKIYWLKTSAFVPPDER